MTIIERMRHKTKGSGQHLRSDFNDSSNKEFGKRRPDNTRRKGNRDYGGKPRFKSDNEQHKFKNLLDSLEKPSNQIDKFEDMALPQEMLSSLKNIGFVEPTSIQSMSIPAALEGRNIMGSANTGTGKTGAFLIPIITGILSGKIKTALVMTPTRELAIQVADVYRNIIKSIAKPGAALLIGGEPIVAQFKQLKKQPNIIIGTPGRIYDHIDRGSFMTDIVDFCVLDEADKMLDIDFGEQIDEIMTCIKNNKQTMIFSATLPPKIINLAQKYLDNPVLASVTQEGIISKKLNHTILEIEGKQKYSNLVKVIGNTEGSVLVFVSTRNGADLLSERLMQREDYKVVSIHGNLKQTQRRRAINNFKHGKTKIMVATDVAARGIDIPNIEHVINYDMPQCPEDYIHRIGRTARAGMAGAATSFVTPSDYGIWNAIKRVLKV